MSELKLLIEMVKNLHTDLTKVSDKVADIREEQLKQSFDIARNTKDVEYHIKRSDLLEEDVSILRTDVEDRLDNLEAPKKTRKRVAAFVIRTSAVITGISGVIAIVYKFIF